MDVDGLDAACKVVIMANWILNKKLTLKDVRIQGIRAVTLKEIAMAKNSGNAIKLLGTINEGASVAPAQINRHDPLCVGGVLNAVTFISEFAGEETIVGKGAGGSETASAVLRDLIDIRHNMANKGFT